MTQKKTNKITCPNCEKKYNSDFAYCPHCGQKNTEPDLKFRHVFQDFLAGMFNVDSKFFQTFKLLLLSPGKLSKEYLSGKRTKYMTPVRIYLIVSFLYFGLLSLLPSGIIVNNMGEGSTAHGISFELSDTDSTVLKKTTPDTLKEKRNIADLEKELKEKIGKINTTYGKKAFSELLRKYISIGMFFLIPLTALIFYLMFYKGTYYIQHLVFVLHLQSVMFILFIFFDLIELVIDNNFISFLNVVAFLFFLLIWIKRFYEKGWWQTIWKTMLFLFYFGFLFVIFLIVVAGATYWNV